MKKAGEAKIKTENAQDEETINLAYLSAITEHYTSGEDESAKIASELEKTYGSGKVTVIKSGSNYFVNITGKGKFIIDANGSVTYNIRAGIKIGDYISYTSPTASVTFNDDETGYSTYSTPVELARKTLFRVMDIDEDGNMELMGAMTSDDPTIYFSGAQGYNNAVYVLNKKCNDLYKNVPKGITARSIKEEDITSRFNSTGTGKITAYIDERVGNVETPTSNTLTAGTNIDSVSATNKTVTYKNSRSYYPNLFQYEAGGLIGTTETGIPETNPKKTVARSASYNGYGTDGILTNLDKTGTPATSIPQFSKVSGTGTLTVPFTYSYSSHDANDFEDVTNKTAYNSMFFGTNTSYWLASRCICCHSDYADFLVRRVRNSGLYVGFLYYSSGWTDCYADHVCPVVSIPSDVQVTVSTDNSTYHQSEPHTVVTN